MSDTLTHQEAQLRFNDRSLPCPQGQTLAALLEAQGVASNQVATAVNGEFVPFAMRASTTLKPGDTVLTFQAIVGG
ncbi:sulfur carrier protein [Hydrogenophaga palleronii]|uniref:Sulfur carrier protein n=1 Tax=Hydrogenophaga palleronii TaxID=65655 RepID=A0ABU1WQ14_9BURK|nr:sulfur carrier protein ThiS [Hydrogenophaga palleronii]MDR7151390.1 sulfur carrier protein [Hydrogenophaga palleronii]